MKNWVFNLAQKIFNDSKRKFEFFPYHSYRHSWGSFQPLFLDKMSLILEYRGLKEDVYAPYIAVDNKIKKELGIKDGDLVVTVRPPATEAHYHNPEAEALCEHFLNRVYNREHTKVILLPRNGKQNYELKSKFPEWFKDSSNIVIPSRVIDGMNLVWHSDLVLSGGGTMNREAASLGVPVYSIFRGRPGAVDLKLESDDRLKFIATKEEVDRDIKLVPREKTSYPDRTPRDAVKDILGHIQKIIGE